MKILLTGATGYIGKRILPVLVDAGHEVICCVRDKSRFKPPEAVKQKIKIIQIDLLVKESLDAIPRDIDGAYYLVHSMSASSDYQKLEQESAINFRNALNETKVRHVNFNALRIFHLPLYSNFRVFERDFIVSLKMDLNVSWFLSKLIFTSCLKLQ